jgi:hypothetical protein
MAAGKPEPQMPADGIEEVSTGVEMQEEQVQDKQYIATLLKQIKEHQEAYGILYNRNLLLHNEVTDANQMIECLRADKMMMSFICSCRNKKIGAKYTTETSPES